MDEGGPCSRMHTTTNKHSNWCRKTLHDLSHVRALVHSVFLLFFFFQNGAVKTPHDLSPHVYGLVPLIFFFIFVFKQVQTNAQQPESCPGKNLKKSERKKKENAGET